MRGYSERRNRKRENQKITALTPALRAATALAESGSTALTKLNISAAWLLYRNGHVKRYDNMIDIRIMGHDNPRDQSPSTPGGAGLRSILPSSMPEACIRWLSKSHNRLKCPRRRRRIAMEQRCWCAGVLLARDSDNAEAEGPGEPNPLNHGKIIC